MKTIIISFALLLQVFSYNLYSQNNNEMDQQLVITPEFETFDTIRFERLVKPQHSSASEKLQDSTIIQMVKRKGGSQFAIIPVDSYFGIDKRYYPSGNIKEKGLSFVYGDFRKGTWYYFDEKGNLKDEIDHDKPFKFTFEQILEFAQKQGLYFTKTPVDTNKYIRIPTISNGFNNEYKTSWWKINWFNPEIGKVEIITLDGITGKVISTEHRELLK